MPELLSKEDTAESAFIPSNEEILKTAREEFKAITMRDKNIREEYDKCMAFIALQQWNQDAVTNRGWNIPSLVIDHLGPICSQIVNDWIRNRMAIEIAPADEIASEETAKIFSGYVRNVQYLSKAQTHIDDAFSQMVRGNRGYAGVLTERKPGSFKQQLVIRGFPDSQSVYLADFKRPDQMDLDHGFVRDSCTVAEFKREYPEAEQSDFADWGSDFLDWYTKESQVVKAEYWKLRYRPRKIHLLQRPVRFERDGKPVESDTIYSDELASIPGLPNGFIIETEDEPERQVWQYFITGKEILSRTRWTGKIIPIVPFTGRVVYLKGKKYIFSAISPSLDSQCQLNYAESSAAESMGATVHVPYIAALGSFKTQIQAWQKANIVRYPYLEHDIVIAPNGTVMPAPTRQSMEVEIQGYLMAAQHAADNIRLSSGINKSSLGIDDSRSKSGIAKKVDVQEGDNSSYDFHASGARSVAVLGDILVDVAPKIIGNDEIIQILDEQDKQKSVLVNGDPKNNQGTPKGQDAAHYLDRGEYRVRVNAAPSHQTMREDTEEKLQAVFAELPEPQKVALAAPLLRSMNINGKEELADRVELPEYRKPKDGAPSVPPEALAAIEEGHKLVQMGQQEIARLNRIIDSKILEMEAKKEISAADNETKLAVAEIGKQIAGFEGSIESVKHTLDLMMKQSQMEQAAVESEAGRQHATETQQSDQAHQSALSAQPGTGQ